MKNNRMLVMAMILITNFEGIGSFLTPVGIRFYNLKLRYFHSQHGDFLFSLCLPDLSYVDEHHFHIDSVKVTIHTPCADRARVTLAEALHATKVKGQTRSSGLHCSGSSVAWSGSAWQKIVTRPTPRSGQFPA